MREDNSAAIGEEGVRKRNGWVQVLPDVEITVIECCSDNFEEEFVRLRNWTRNVDQREIMIVPRLGNDDGFWHGEGLAAEAYWLKRGEVDCCLAFRGCRAHSRDMQLSIRRLERPKSRTIL